MAALLEVEQLEAAYGASQVLFGLSLRIDEGETVTLLGRNGMGKTTTVRSIMGLIELRGGVVRFRGRDITGRPSFEIARLGLGLVPEGRQIFPNLSVIENLVATSRSGPWSLERILALFPSLAARRGNLGTQLSGGEQQMLAIGRALMTNPSLLILDEATEGLAPLVRTEIWGVLETLKRDGLSILVIDKNVRALMKLADRHVIIERGRVVWSGTSAELAANIELQHRTLGV